MVTFRKYGNDPFHVVVVHGGPGAVGSVAPLARKLLEHELSAAQQDL